MGENHRNLNSIVHPQPRYYDTKLRLVYIRVPVVFSGRVRGAVRRLAESVVARRALWRGSVRRLAPPPPLACAHGRAPRTPGEGGVLELHSGTPKGLF